MVLTIIDVDGVIAGHLLPWGKPCLVRGYMGNCGSRDICIFEITLHWNLQGMHLALLYVGKFEDNGCISYHVLNYYRILLDLPDSMIKKLLLLQREALLHLNRP